MTANRPSPLLKPAEEPHRRRMAGYVRLGFMGREIPPSMAKSSALQQPNRRMRGPGEPRPPVDVILPNRQAHRRSHSGPSETVKSP
jgi:hypothetical protein